MAAGRHFEKKENRHNSAAISDIFTKFGVLVAMDSPQCSLMSFFGYNKIQDQIQDGTWKVSISIIFATVRPIHFVFGSGIGFSGSADQMTLLPVKPNLRWRLAAILSKNSKWHNSGATQVRDMISSSVVGLSGTADLKFSVSKNPRWRLVAILDILK